MGDRTTRAIRGATTVDSDSPDQIRHATRELLETIVARNGITSADVISAIFTVTHDLTSEFPAHAARELGWLEVPLLCTLEIPVPGSLPKCIRVLLHVQTAASRAEIRHVYLHAARALRPDLAS
ncbi:MAG TPA: chorismate mutase [Gemmatimonadaceae bacterium]|nr:chorismate mutase [Gemmatimonadaceae bacterium]